MDVFLNQTAPWTLNGTNYQRSIWKASERSKKYIRQDIWQDKSSIHLQEGLCRPRVYMDDICLQAVKQYRALDRNSFGPRERHFIFK